MAFAGIARKKLDECSHARTLESGGLKFLLVVWSELNLDLLERLSVHHGLTWSYIKQVMIGCRLMWLVEPCCLYLFWSCQLDHLTQNNVSSVLVKERWLGKKYAGVHTACHAVFSKVHAARKRNFFTQCQCSQNKRTARMLANERKDNSILLVFCTLGHFLDMKVNSNVIELMRATATRKKTYYISWPCKQAVWPNLAVFAAIHTQANRWRE